MPRAPSTKNIPPIKNNNDEVEMSLSALFRSPNKEDEDDDDDDDDDDERAPEEEIEDLRREDKEEE